MNFFTPAFDHILGTIFNVRIFLSGGLAGYFGLRQDQLFIQVANVIKGELTFNNISDYQNNIKQKSLGGNLWHHEGRHARMGVAMIGPDYTQWHGNFDLAENFYTKIVPEVKELIAEAREHGNVTEADNVQKELDAILNSEMHRWYLGKMSPEEVATRKEAAKKFRERYSND